MTTQEVLQLTDSALCMGFCHHWNIDTHHLRDVTDLSAQLYGFRGPLLANPGSAWESSHVESLMVGTRQRDANSVHARLLAVLCNGINLMKPQNKLASDPALLNLALVPWLRTWFSLVCLTSVSDGSYAPY